MTFPAPVRRSSPFPKRSWRPAKFMIFDTKFIIFSTKIIILNARYIVLHTKFKIQNSKFKNLWRTNAGVLLGLAEEVRDLIGVSAPVRMYTQFRPRIRGKLWLLVCIQIPRRRYDLSTAGMYIKLWLFLCIRTKYFARKRKTSAMSSCRTVLL